MKIASVRLGWTKSPSQDVAKVTINLTINGAITNIDLGPEIEEYVVDVQASGTVTFSVTTVDSEGLTATSEVHHFVLGDLEAPMPATGLFHEVLSIRDDTPPEPTTTAGPVGPVPVTAAKK